MTTRDKPGDDWTLVLRRQPASFNNCPAMGVSAWLEGVVPTSAEMDDLGGCRLTIDRSTRAESAG